MKPKMSDLENTFLKALKSEEEGDLNAAEAMYRKAAKSGHVSAQLNLGNLLDDSKIPKAPRGAVYWYRRAVSAGDASAAWNLYVHYSVLGHIAKAEKWFIEAAKLGHPDAKKGIRLSP